MSRTVSKIDAVRAMIGMLNEEASGQYRRELIDGTVVLALDEGGNMKILTSTVDEFIIEQLDFYSKKDMK